MKKKTFKVLSLFDGISCVQIALHAVGIKDYIIYSSEINKKSIRVTQHHFPNTIQVGDVTKLNPSDYRDIDLIVGGSPCQNMSSMGPKAGITTKSGIIIHSLDQYMKLKEYWQQNPSLGYCDYFNESALYWEWMRMLKGIQQYNPNVLYLLENVRSSQWEIIITASMGVDPYMINSNLVSAQNRERNYWTNIPLTKIVDKEIMLWDVIPGAIAGAGRRGRKLKGDDFYSYPLTIRRDNKANCLVTSQRPTGYYIDILGRVHDITPEDAEALQTIPRGYTDLPGISKSARFEMIGNAWTVNVITYFLRNLPFGFEMKDNPKMFVKKY